MNAVTLRVLDERGEALDPETYVSGRLTVAAQPRPWEAPVLLEAGEWETHRLAVASGTEGIRALRYLEAADGTQYRVLGKSLHSAGLGPQLDYWRVRTEPH